MTLRPLLAILSLTLGLCGCASMFKPAPPSQATPANTNQRVVLESSAGVICAEPSTGLLAALSGSPGGGTSAQGKGATPLPPALREAAVAAVLKTQWSTLMRDQLYRICEAYYNKAIGGPQVMELVLRAQDLAFATVALEHLTAALGHSATSTGSSDTAPSSGVAQLQALLDLSRRNEQTKSALVQADMQVLEQKKASLVQAQAALSSAESKRASDEEKKQLAAAVAQTKLEVAAAAENLKSAQDLADEAARTRQAIEKSFEIAQAEERTSKATNAIPSAQAAAVDQASAGQLAIAVKDIVTAVVNRDYMAQGCFTLLTVDTSTAAMSPEQAASRAELVKFCMGVMQSAQTR